LNHIHITIIIAILRGLEIHKYIIAIHSPNTSSWRYAYTL